MPEGSRALAGIGCHYMTVWMDRSTSTFSQMGGEGVAWIGQAPFTNDKHVFANLGDGTYFHSGLLAIRAAIAAKVNITYKILYNDAVAMTGGQPVDGVLTVPQITHQVAAEGASRIVIVTDEPEKYSANVGLAPGIDVHHRDKLDEMQRELREISGTTILIYDQTCATEKRRRRKRGAYPDPAKRVVINEAVCEGCGDCSVKSNCLSVEPLETEYGTKRQINQSSCNKDYSCLNGFCPSFVTVEGGQLKKPKVSAVAGDTMPPVPEPELPPINRPYGVLVTGVGGTGVVTIGALLGMAAHLEQKGVTVLDMTGLAQKGGAVMSHVQIANKPADIHATRIAMGEADLVIGCDAIVTASDECGSRMQPDHTRVVVNSAQTPTAEFIKNPNWRFPGASAEADIRAAAGEHVALVDANQCAVALLGDAIYTNPFVLGFAWQRGWVPLRHESLVRAIELNAVQVEKNLAAFEWGRRAAHDPEAVRRIANSQGKSAAQDGTSKIIALHTPKALDTLIDKRLKYLADYQNEAYAARYGRLVAQVRTAEAEIGPSRRTVSAVGSRRPEPAQADGLQGRVRSRAPLRRSGFRGEAEGQLRRRLEAQVPPRAAGVLEEGRERAPRQEAVRSVGPARDARAREDEVPARHGVRRVRQDGRAQDGARVDRRVRGAGEGADRRSDAAEARARDRTGEPARLDARLWPREGQQRARGQDEVEHAAREVARRSKRGVASGGVSHVCGRK